MILRPKYKLALGVTFSLIYFIGASIIFFRSGIMQVGGYDGNIQFGVILASILLVAGVCMVIECVLCVQEILLLFSLKNFNPGLTG